MKRSPVLEFELSSFMVKHDGDQETSAGISGKSLAAWLAAQLQHRQIETDDVLAEDFGWCVPVGSWPHRAYVVCASEDNQTDNKWRVFAFAEGGVLARLLCEDDNEKSILEVYTVVRLILESAPEIRALTESQGLAATQAT